MRVILMVVAVAAAATATVENSPEETIPGREASHLRLVGSHVRRSDCRKQIFRLADALTKSAPRAVKSAGFPERPRGFIYGNDHRFGDYEACVAADGYPRRRYCLVDVAFAPEPRKYPNFYSDSNDREFSLDRDPNESFLEPLRVTRDPTKRRRNVYHSGMCVPESCSLADVEEGVNGAVMDIASEYGYVATARLQEHSCSTSEESSTLTTGGRIVCCVILILLKLVLVATIWDAFRGKNAGECTRFEMIALSFSAKNNLGKLGSAGVDRLDVLNGMKALSMMLVILGHRCMSSFGGPVMNVAFMEESYRWFPSIFLLNGIVIVDTFFFVGGFLTFKALRLLERENGREWSAIKVCVYRWLRIVPEYMLTVFFYGYVLEHLGSGPIWSAKVAREAERCRDNWWTNLLFINNYVNTNRLCMFQSWYVACDMHFTLISTLIAKWIAKFERKGLAILIACILAASIAVSVITYINEYDGFMRLYYAEFEDLANSFFFSQVYIRSHNRIIPYLSGMTAACVYIRLRESNIQLSENVVRISTVLALFCGLGSIGASWIFYVPGRKYSAVENALYASLHRLFWSLCIGWITIASGRKGFGMVQPILSNKMFAPLSKLTFGAYLIHGAIQIYTTATLRAPDYMSFPNLFWMASGDLVLSFFFALLLHLTVEAPMRGFQKLLFSAK